MEIDEKNKMLESVVSYLSAIDFKSMQNKGFMTGKTGIALFLYAIPSSFSFYQRATETAGHLLQSIWSLALWEEAVSFKSGQVGIAFALDWLREKELLDLENQKFFKGVEAHVLQLKVGSPIQLDLESNLFSSGMYLYKRYLFYKEYNQQHPEEEESLISEYTMREFMIYYTDECERILYKTSFMYESCLPELNLPTLNSIIYFLLKCHELQFFPYKTETLLTYCYDLSTSYQGKGNMVDQIVLHAFRQEICRLLGLKEILFAIQQEGHFSEKDFSELPAYAAWSSLIYGNPDICEEAWNILLEKKPDLLSTLISKMKKNKLPLSMDGVAGIGYGLLNRIDH